MANVVWLGRGGSSSTFNVLEKSRRGGQACKRAPVGVVRCDWRMHVEESDLYNEEGQEENQVQATLDTTAPHRQPESR